MNPLKFASATKITLALTLFLAGTGHCAPRASISSAPFGPLPDGRIVHIFTLSNGRGMQAKITDYGGILTSLRVPDKDGHLGDIVLGYDNLASYLKASPYFGATIGRYGNRIAKGRFPLDGKTYQLATNNAPNHLHGGKIGFDKRLWRATPCAFPTVWRWSYVISVPLAKKAIPAMYKRASFTP